MMQFLQASDTALLVQTDSLEEAVELNLAWRHVDCVRELVPGASTVLVHFDPARITVPELVARLRAVETSGTSSGPRRHIIVPVTYDGEDLTEVAELLGLSEQALVARHLEAEWTVAFSGFAPGFGYAKSADPLFDVPRRTSPRTRVPAGAVGLAGVFTGIYPRESPGGWQLIGHTREALWDINRDPPALMAPGTVVRFQRESRGAVVLSSKPAKDHHDDAVAHGDAVGSDATGDQPTAAQACVPVGGNAVTVIRAGLQMLVQDMGRSGHAALGVSTSGAADGTAMDDANRAVGNPAGSPVLECVGAVELEYHGAAGVGVVTGAQGHMRLLAPDGTQHRVEAGVPFAVQSGDHLSLDYPGRGLRYVVTFRGGLEAQTALGSAAADTLAGMGPAPLRAGDHVALGQPSSAPYAVDPSPVERHLPAPGDTVELAITLGPRHDWFTPSALHTLVQQEWEVTAESDRVGLRLRGDVALERRITGELPSEGAVTGAIQVPAEGQPVLFLPDHPLTGGYPIVGAVTREHLDLAAQLPPGVRVRFRVRETEHRELRQGVAEQGESR